MPKKDTRSPYEKLLDDTIIEAVRKSIEREKTMLKKYKCHKVVTAGKIQAIDYHSSGTCLIAIEGAGEVVHGSAEYTKRLPKFTGDEGEDLGYYVRYKDGYESWSPSEAFEDGYHKLEFGMTVTFDNPEAFQKYLDDRGPNMGLATTGQLIEELTARIEIDGKLNERPVDNE